MNETVAGWAINLVKVSLQNDSSKTEHTPPEFRGISEVF